MAKLSLIVKQKKVSKYKVRKYNRCKICGRPHAFIRDFQVCRLCFRNLANLGKIPGVRKSSW